MPMARGREEIRRAIAAHADAGITDLRFETLEVEERGDTVLELARSTAYKGSERVGGTYYVIVWHRDADGDLRLHWDVVSTSHER